MAMSRSVLNEVWQRLRFSYYATLRTMPDAPGITDDKFARANVLVSRRFEELVAFEEVQAAEQAGAGCLLTHRVQLSLIAVMEPGMIGVMEPVLGE